MRSLAWADSSIHSFPSSVLDQVSYHARWRVSSQVLKPSGSAGSDCSPRRAPETFDGEASELGGTVNRPAIDESLVSDFTVAVWPLFTSTMIVFMTLMAV